MSIRVQLNTAIKEGLHGTVASDTPKASLLRRASLQPIGELEGVISSADMAVRRVPGLLISFARFRFGPVSSLI